ncbi:cytochrome o ubiquinol oxidase subunit IV [Cardiobacteriaceae bacterium TAE3-ERU3]|nr:cytochrome o ubiquinol oxidase subunit IV [Cardiobacteriaceae bacterium TAE3-ERU3]
MSDESLQHGSGEAVGHAKDYIIGLILSIILTALPFAMVMGDLGSQSLQVAVILVCCIAQILVQMVFFLHMNMSSSQIWNSASAIYTVVILLAIVIGSMWIFEHLNHNMMMGH